MCGTEIIPVSCVRKQRTKQVIYVGKERCIFVVREQGTKFAFLQDTRNDDKTTFVTVESEGEEKSLTTNPVLVWVKFGERNRQSFFFIISCR